MTDNTEQSSQRTRVFARVLGPFFLIVPSAIAAHYDTLMPILFRGFVADPMWQWWYGAFLLIVSLIIISQHQYWRSVAAALISLLGWVLFVRGVLMLALPHAYIAVGESVQQPGANGVTRIFFIGLALVGLYLTYVGWVAKPGRRPEATKDPADAESH